MNIEFDEDAHEFFVDYLFWKTTLNFGDEFAFLLNSDLNDLQLAALSKTAKQGALFGNDITGAAIQFTASAVAFVSAKDMPGPTASALAKAFDFGFVQGIKQSDLHCDYWGLSKGDGVVTVHVALSNRDEVDTTNAVKPFTRLPANRCSIKPIPSKRPGFHAFSLHAQHSDHPQFIFKRYQSAAGPKDLMPHRMYLRSAACQLDFATVFALRDTTTGKLDGISATEWRVRWKHVVTYEEKRNKDSMDYQPTVTGPDKSDLMPTVGNPAGVNERVRNILAMAQAGGPFMTPEVLNARLRASSGITITKEDDNPDFDASFIKRAT